MTRIDINMPAPDDLAVSIARVEQTMSDHRLRLVSRGTLKTIPGCIHWHYKNGGQRGTLEITLWPQKKELWFKVQSGRRAEWMDEMIPRLKEALERKSNPGSKLPGE